MSLALVYSRARTGITAPLVTVEVHISNGLPSLSIVGLPEAAVRESRERVRSALLNAGFDFPPRRITINLAPADLPKEGGRFDLAIAVGILAASQQLNGSALENHEFIGELSLAGDLRPVPGILCVCIHTRESGRSLVLPRENAAEASLVESARIHPAAHLLQVCAYLNGQHELEMVPPVEAKAPDGPAPDFRDVHEQFHAKRALEIAAAGRHNLLMLGPPGTGKSMLASRMPSILPPLDESQALETAALTSISESGLNPREWRKPPFRSPHHSASAAALVGGGSNPKPGEISRAHNGVLFLDELPEFDRNVLEVLREPLETGMITISRASNQCDFPARFQLIAAMNPCPCGYLGDSSGRCRCTPTRIARYHDRISGPLLDRIDMHIEVPRVAAAMLRSEPAGESENSATIRDRVARARERATQRAGNENATLTTAGIKKFCALGEQDHRLLEQAMEQLQLSNRAYHRILKVARTIADLDASDRIETRHLSEAISFRKLDRNR